MLITLQQLNESYPALMRLASREIPKEHHGLAFKLARILKSARPEIDLLAESLNDLMVKCGFQPGQQAVAPDKLRDYNERATALMRETTVEIAGAPISYNALAGIVPISPVDLVLLDWLISDDSEKG